MSRSFQKIRERAPQALTLTKFRAVAPQAHQTGLSFSLPKQDELEQLEQERERARDERHELTMRLLIETLDRRLRSNSPPRERSNDANDVSKFVQTQRTETKVQRSSIGPHAKTRPTEPIGSLYNITRTNSMEAIVRRFRRARTARPSPSTQTESHVAQQSVLKCVLHCNWPSV